MLKRAHLISLFAACSVMVVMGVLLAAVEVAILVWMGVQALRWMGVNV